MRSISRPSPSTRAEAVRAAPLVAGALGLGVLGLGARRAVADRRAREATSALFDRAPAPPAALPDDLPEPARRYLAYAVGSGGPRAAACRLWMSGVMMPVPGRAPVVLTAVETLAPRHGFVWTARTRVLGLPVHVRDQYLDGEGGLSVTALGLVPIPTPHGPDVTRSARGRLVAEAVWCPTALVPPGVRWEAVDADRARYSIPIDGESVVATVHVGPEGQLRDVTLERWGDVGGATWEATPYGFRVEAERVVDGVTIPTRLTGGWHYGTDRFDPAEAATFTVHNARFARSGGPVTSGA